MKIVFFNFFCLFLNVFSIIVFPFRSIFTDIKSNSTEDTLFHHLMENKIYSNIKIGSPSQDIGLFYSSLNYSFYITKDLCYGQNTYNPKESSTYKLVDVRYDVYYGEEHFKSGIGEDTLIVNNNIFLNESKTIEGVEYILTEDIETLLERSCGYIGLALSGKNEPNNNNIFNQLASLKIIESPTWTIKYMNDDNGQFIIGGLPHEYDTSYKQEQYQSANSYLSPGEGQWMIKFNKIISLIDMSNTVCKFTIENNLFIGTEEYQQNIEEQFLGKFMDEGICSKVKASNEYYYYICEHYIIEDKDNFPKLKFFHSILNYTFVFNFDDLFQRIDDGRLFFNVVFSDKIKNNFILGKIFLKKYQLIFNSESKTIGFYNKDIILTEKTSIIKTIVSIIIIIVGIVILFFLFVFIKKIYRHHKLRGNALAITTEFFNRQQQEDLIARAIEEEQERCSQNLELRTKDSI